jgi:hypothetical protein
MLDSLKFKKGGSWKYVPYHIISNLRVVFKSSSYIHYTNLELERLANKESWKDIKFILQGKHVQ